MQLGTLEEKNSIATPKVYELNEEAASNKSQKKRFLDQDKLTFFKNKCKKLKEAVIISIIDQPIYTSNIVLVPKYKSFRDNSKASSIVKKRIKKVAIK